MLGTVIRCLLFSLLLTGFGFAMVATGDTKEIGPEQDLCAEIHALRPGDELVLRPGEYQGPCAIRNGGTAERPIVIRARDLEQRPRIVYTPERENALTVPSDRGTTLTVRADHVTIRGLAFGPTRRGVDAIRARSADSLTIEDCTFEGLGGIAVAASHRAEGRRLTIRRNRIVNSGATAIYIGCHDGVRCAILEVLMEGNYIHGVDAPDPEIGYGVQFKLNTWGWIRDNVIGNTKGPGIMVYGATHPDRVSVVERNAVSGSRTSAGIVLGGGPAIVRNNVATESAEGGIQLEDYGGRGLLRNIAIAHNTIYNNGTGGITIYQSAPVSEAWVVNNAVHARPGTAPFPAEGDAIRSRGNVDCSSGGCFRAPGERDFSPAPGSPLVGAAANVAQEWMPKDDFGGTPRRGPASVGAFEGPGAPIPLGVKRPGQ